MAADADPRVSAAIVLAARGYPGEGAIAYGPIAELLRAGLATPDGAPRLGALDEHRAIEIGRLVDLPVGLRVAGVRGRRRSASEPSARVRLLDAIAAR